MEFRKVGAIGYDADVGEEDDQILTVRQLRSICAAVRKSRAAPADDGPGHAAITQELQRLAWSHRRQRQQLQPSRGEAAYELALVAHLTFKLEGRLSPGRSRKLSDELRALLPTLNPIAQAQLLGGFIAAGVASPGIDTDWMLDQPLATLGAAAMLGWQRLHGGDYSDVDLYCTLLQFVDLFEWATGRQATYWVARPPNPEQMGKGDFPQIAGSGCGRAAIRFFAYVEPALNPVTISDVLKKTLLSREKNRSNLFPN